MEPSTVWCLVYNNLDDYDIDVSVFSTFEGVLSAFDRCIDRIRSDKMESQKMYDLVRDPEHGVLQVYVDDDMGSRFEIYVRKADMDREGL